MENNNEIAIKTEGIYIIYIREFILTNKNINQFKIGKQDWVPKLNLELGFVGLVVVTVGLINTSLFHLKRCLNWSNVIQTMNG